MTVTFELATPQDLLQKARHERTTLQDALTSQDKKRIAYALFNFAVTAYHVKDWLKKPATSSYSGPDVEDHVKAHVPLLVCRDICNASKHQRITKYTQITGSVNQSATGTGTLVHSIQPSGDVTLESESTAAFRVKVVTTDGTRIEAGELADRVIAAWKTFCKDRGLSTQDNMLRPCRPPGWPARADNFLQG